MRKTSWTAAKGFWRPILILLSLAFIPATAAASTHYISSSLGNDSNSGTSKTSPWAHAPGMKTCSANCAAYTPVAGDQFIFYGGDTWTVSNFQWNIHWSGSSGSPIYFGVDTSWYSPSVCGSSFCQPVADFQNTLVSSTCGGVTCAGVFVQGNYVTIDNMEFLHFRMANANLRSQFRGDLIHGPDTGGGTLAYGDVIQNCLFKDWGMEGTVAPGTSADLGQAGVNGGFLGTSALQFTGNTIDDQNGSCGSPTTGCYTGSGIAAGYITKYNVCRYTNNCFDVAVQGTLLQGNVVHDMYLSTDQASGSDTGNHENPIYGKCYSTLIGNIVYNIPGGATLQLYANCSVTSGTWYTANNMIDLTGSYSACWVDRTAVGRTEKFYHYNDTCVPPGTNIGTDNGDAVRDSVEGGTCPASITVVNMHVIAQGWSGGSSAITSSAASAAVDPFVHVDSGCTSPTVISVTTSVPMSTATAASQGYTLSNWYQPTLASNATVAMGTNESTQCSGSLTGLCSALDPSDLAVSLVSRLSSTSWDVGAYQFSGATDASSTTLAPPTGLTATVY